VDIFPNGFSQIGLVRNFGQLPMIDFTKSPLNTALVAGGTKTLNITDTARFESGYYSLSLSATDLNGNNVKGESKFFAVEGNGPLPPLGINSIKL
jgi:hypothetical protein